MYRIIDKKCSGKTSRLLLLAKENNAIVVCQDPNHMKEKAYAYGITGLEFMSYIGYDYEVNHCNKKIDKPILIDVLDNFLKYESNVIGYTISED